MTETLEHTARRIAERGREALLARLRPAFTEAARAHSDVLSLDGDQLEQMVQRAADRADGLQWRRALADVATEELGISLGEALSHPAVARAQAIVGAPSYEDSLAALGPAPGGSVKPAPARASGEKPEARVERDEAPSRQASAEAEEAREDAEETDEAEEVPAHPEERDVAEEPPGAGAGAQQADAEARGDAEAEDLEAEDAQPSPAAQSLRSAEVPVSAADADDDDDDDEAHTLRLAAVHIGGIANLEPAEQGIALLLSEDGLDIARGPDELLGRLRWPEIRSLDVSQPRGLRRRRRSGAHLVIRTRHGDATFEIPEASSEELETQLQPLLQRHAAS